MSTSEALRTAIDEIQHLVEPHLYPAEQIASCIQIPLDAWARSPFPPKANQDPKSIWGRNLFERLIGEGWKTVMIGLIRDDGSPNYGHEPTVNHSLVAVMVKLKGS